jgi:bacterial/archaeal transporter family protein
MWFWFALLSAIFSAVSIVLNKKALNNINASIVSWSLFAFSIPFLIIPTIKEGIPELNNYFWIGAIGSIVSFAFAKTLALKSLKGSLVSEVIPIAFFSVLFQYVFGLMFFSETIRIVPFLGLLMIIVGGYFLKVEEAREDLLKPFKLLFTNKNAFMYLIAMLIITITSIFDKTAIINMKPTNQSFYLLLGNIITTILIGIYLTKTNRNWGIELKKNFWILMFGAIAYTGVSLSYLYGITTGSLALVSGVKKFEVFFVLVIGWILFKDKPKLGVWIGSLIMLVGVILIKLG